ncbi:response regulator transcription factor [Aminipila sp.]|uniref:response regulator transcription factor n=1 Tax=Aminipila sp. TaxID=2060095 RepID=UPI00289F4DB2|nr:response regulator transcription factor [Aminipila sp.]
MADILIIDDDKELCVLLKQCLQNDGYNVHVLHNGNGVSELLKGIDLVILDVMLPGENGFDVLKRIRNISDIPVLMLSAKSSEMDKVIGLRTGADDYLTKPFGLSELIARVDNLIERFKVLNNMAISSEPLKFNNLKIDTKKCIVIKNNSAIALTAKEYRLLCFFAQNPMQVFTKRQIYQNVWDEDFMYDDNTIMALICRLRKKLEDNPENPTFIQTVWGIGYRFNNEGTV